MKVEFYMKVKLLCKLFECSRLQVLLKRLVVTCQILNLQLLLSATTVVRVAPGRSTLLLEKPGIELKSVAYESNKTLHGAGTSVLP